MKLTKLAHAGIQVQTKECNVIMDPIFEKSFGAYFKFLPDFKFNLKEFKRQKWDIVIISHDHVDHFSPQTLKLFDKKTLFVIPESNMTLHKILSFMGFNNLIGLKPYQTFKYKDLTLTATPSIPSLNEMGIVFESRKKRIWNFVDSLPTDSEVKKIKNKFKKFDVALVFYQQLREYIIHHNLLTGGFLAPAYIKHLDRVQSILPNITIPSACGWAFEEGSWVNRVMFPISPFEFIEDLKKKNIKTKGLYLWPGEEIDLSKSNKKTSSKFIATQGPKAPEKLDLWRPHYEIPELTDKNPLNLPLSEVKKTIDVITKEMFEFIKSMKEDEMLSPYYRNRIHWILEIIFPDKSRKFLYVHFDPKKVTVRTQKPKGQFYSLHTLVTASTVVNIYKGNMHPVALFVGSECRVSTKVFSLSEKEETDFQSQFKDPFTFYMAQVGRDRYYYQQAK